MAPALTIGFTARPPWSSMAITESKPSPVALTPKSRCASSWPKCSQMRAKTKGFEMLWIEKR